MTLILCRCDASLSISSGHAMRCHTLARIAEPFQPEAGSDLSVGGGWLSHRPRNYVLQVQPETLRSP